MSFSFVGVSGEGSTVIVNGDDLPQTSNDGFSTIIPFSSILNTSFSSIGNFSTITTHPGFSISSPWNPYAQQPEPPPQFEELPKKRYEPPTMSLSAAAARKKRKQNFFEEEEATCAKCHYRRKCMKCTNCFARFCEQRCLPRYLEDSAAQEEVKLTNSWLCPCCKGIEPPGKYKGSDILRKDVEDAKDKEDDEDDKPTTSSNGTTQTIIPQSPIQTHTPFNSQTYVMNPSPQTSSFPHYMQPSPQQLQLQHMQQQQLKLQQHQMQLQQQQLLEQQQLQQQMLLQQQQFQIPQMINPQQLQMRAQQIAQAQASLQLPFKQDIPDGADDTQKKERPKPTGGVAQNGGLLAVPGEGDPNEYPKETEDHCGVCGDTFSYDDNEIIYCDGCNVAVHQACYGVNKIPAGEWLCDRCKGKVLPACYFCSQKGGAMKELVDLPNHWVHVTCVATLFELRPLDYSHKIGPPGILDKIDKRRYTLKCSHCKETGRKDIAGPLIQCKSKRCTQAFHPICSIKKLYFDKELGIFVTYCPKHVNEAPKNS